MTWQYWLLCGCLVVGGLSFFFVISKFGAKIVAGDSSYEVTATASTSTTKKNNNNFESYEFEAVA